MPSLSDFEKSLRASNPLCNWGARWCKQQDTEMGMFQVRRGHRTLGLARRGNPGYDIEQAFGSLELFEQRVFEEQIVEHAMRLLE